MVYTESIRGYPYMRKEQLTKEFQISAGTVRTRLFEIEDEIKTGRYNDYAIIRDGNIVLINVLVFIDYLTYRRQLLDRNARKYAPAFHPEKLVQMIGIINACVDADTGHRARREENMSVGELVALGILVVIWIHSLLKN